MFVYSSTCIVLSRQSCDQRAEHTPCSLSKWGVQLGRTVLRVRGPLQQVSPVFCGMQWRTAGKFQNSNGVTYVCHIVNSFTCHCTVPIFPICYYSALKQANLTLLQRYMQIYCSTPLLLMELDLFIRLPKIPEIWLTSDFYSHPAHIASSLYNINSISSS